MQVHFGLWIRNPLHPRHHWCLDFCRNHSFEFPLSTSSFQHIYHLTSGAARLNPIKLKLLCRNGQRPRGSGFHTLPAKPASARPIACVSAQPAADTRSPTEASAGQRSCLLSDKIYKAPVTHVLMRSPRCLSVFIVTGTWLRSMRPSCRSISIFSK